MQFLNEKQSPLLSDHQTIVIPEEVARKPENSRCYSETVKIFPFIKRDFTIRELFSAKTLSFFLFLFDLSLYLLLVSLYSENSFEIPAKTLVKFGAKHRQKVKDGEIWRLFSANFLHLDAIHLFSNMYVQIMFGALLEKFIGTWQFLFIYVSSGAIGFLASCVFSNAISVGASAAIFGCFAMYPAFLLRNYREIRKFPYLKCCLLTFIAAFIVINAVFEFFYWDLLDHGAHFFGYFNGFLLGVLLVPPLEISSFSRKVELFAGFALFCGYCSLCLYFFCS